MNQLFLQIGVDNVEYREEYDKGIWICLSDIVHKIIESKKPKDYMYKIKNKQLMDDKYYIPLEQTKKILEKSKKAKTRPLYAELCKLKPSIKINEDKQEPIEEEEECKDIRPLVEINEDTKSFPNELKDTFLDIHNNYFKYKGKDVFVITIDNVVWFKGKDVANLFDFSKPEDAINHSVSKEDKIEFINQNLQFNQTLFENKNIHPQTIFINLEGVYDLIMSSRKPEAKIFRRWLSHYVLPALNKFGSYSLGKKFGNFYDTEDLFEYQNQNVFYLAYIGVHKNEPLFKFGISYDYCRREYKEHKKTFQIFDLIYLRRTDNNRQIEELFKKECQIKELYRKLDINGKQYTEIFTINEKNSFDRMRIILEKIIEQYPTKEIERRDKKIQDLENENKILKTKLEEKEELVIELKKDKSWLQNLLEKFKMM